MDAIATYLALGVRTPISPGGGSKGNQYGHLKQGRELFEAAGCQNCHGAPTPAASQIVDAS